MRSRSALWLTGGILAAVVVGFSGAGLANEPNHERVRLRAGTRMLAALWHAAEQDVAYRLPQPVKKSHDLPQGASYTALTSPEEALPHLKIYGMVRTRISRAGCPLSWNSHFRLVIVMRLTRGSAA